MLVVVYLSVVERKVEAITTCLSSPIFWWCMSFLYLWFICDFLLKGVFQICGLQGQRHYNLTMCQRDGEHGSRGNKHHHCSSLATIPTSLSLQQTLPSQCIANNSNIILIMASGSIATCCQQLKLHYYCSKWHHCSMSPTTPTSFIKCNTFSNSISPSLPHYFLNLEGG
jgi:hypothetical protein